jgi:enolase-phosphatase E1
MNIKAIVTDIEGTTSSIAFVYDTLFPYARKKLPDFVRKHAQQPDMVNILADTMVEADEAEASTERCIEILLQWMTEDKKATPLKALQGMIWEHGYALSDFTGHVYDDAASNLAAWHDAGIDLYVYSSGSVKAQQLLFSHSDAGDLTPLFKGYFDTRIGQKREVESYKAIIDHIGLPADEILFLSDSIEELDAARDAGMQTIQLVRDNTEPSDSHLVAHSFDDIQP